MNTVDFCTTLGKLIKQHGADPDLKRLGSKLLYLRPQNSMGFPYCDHTEVLETDTDISLTIFFMGLYGVDSPLPRFINEICAKQDVNAIIVRDFLDIWHTRSYVLFFQACQILYPELALLFDRHDYLNTYYCLQAATSGKAKIYQILHKFLPHIPVKIKSMVAGWSVLTAHNQPWILGDTMILGNAVYNGNHKIHIEIGPVGWELRQSLEAQIRLHLGLQLEIKLTWIFTAASRTSLDGTSQLGQNSRLI